MPRLLGGMLLLWTTAALAQTVEGTVSAVNGAGIPGVGVQMLRDGEDQYDAITDQQGRFHIDDVKPGSYMVSVQTQQYLMEGGLFRRALEVTAGAPAQLDIRMTPLSKLSVKVVDRTGKPVEGAKVQLTGRHWVLGSMTNHDGFANAGAFYVQPETFSIWALPPDGIKPPDAEADGRVLTWAKTWYPGVDKQEAAGTVTIGAGDAREVEIKLETVTAHAVRGLLLDADGNPAAKTRVTIAQDYRTTVDTSEDGSFEFPAVRDGEWQITAQQGDPKAGMRAMEWVEMADRDVDGLKLRLSPPFAVTGKIVVEVPKGTPAPKLPSVLLIPRSNRAGRSNEMRPDILKADPDDQASLRWENAYAGVYRIEARNKLPAPFYLDAVRMGDRDVGNQEMEFDGPVNVTLVYKTNGGTVRGTVENCSSGGVWLVPQEMMRRGRNYLRYAGCDDKGHYQITAVRPGGYYVLMYPREKPVAWLDALLDEGLLKRAGTVTVGPNETATADGRAQ